MTPERLSKKIKILVCGVLPPPKFGHSMMYEALMSSAFVDTFDIIFLDMKFWTYGQHNKVNVEKLFKMVWYFLRYIWLILLCQPKYVLYNMSFYPMPFLKDALFCGTGILLGRRVIVHDMGQYVRELSDSLPLWKRNVLHWMLCHVAASIIMGEAVRGTYKGLMLPAKLFVVPGAAEDSKHLSVEPDQPQGVNILYFSHMSRLKGIFVAFEAASLLLKERGDLQFTFAGPMENDRVAQSLRNLQAQFPGRVRYLGYIEGIEERTQIFRGADIFIFPTLRDVFGLVLLHAMAEGLPVVASREGTIPEIIPNDKHGLLFEKGNARALADGVLVLTGDESRRRAMGVANRQRFEKFYSFQQYGIYMIEAFDKIDVASSKAV